MGNAYAATRSPSSSSSSSKICRGSGAGAFCMAAGGGALAVLGLDPEASSGNGAGAFCWAAGGGASAVLGLDESGWEGDGVGSCFGMGIGCFGMVELGALSATGVTPVSVSSSAGSMPNSRKLTPLRKDDVNSTLGQKERLGIMIKINQNRSQDKQTSKPLQLLAGTPTTTTSGLAHKRDRLGECSWMLNDVIGMAWRRIINQIKSNWASCWGDGGPDNPLCTTIWQLAPPA